MPNGFPRPTQRPCRLDGRSECRAFGLGGADHAVLQLWSFNVTDGGQIDLSSVKFIVIVHELLHFFVPNHGKLWKSLMRAHLGEYEACAAELKRMAS
ncbi:MAG: YgjP-like metallopeptidase domain-containing protein [Thermodesulfobacteriota bacterium]